MFCVECGEKLEDRMKFCPRCGTKVEQLAPAKEDNNNSNGNTVTAEKPKMVKPDNGAVETVSAFQEGEYYRYRFRNTSATIQIQEILQGTKKVRATVQKGSMARQLYPDTRPIDQRFEKSKSMKDYYQNMVSNGFIVEQAGSELAEVQKEFIFEGSLSALATMLSGESIAPVKAWKLVKDGGTVQQVIKNNKKESENIMKTTTDKNNASIEKKEIKSNGIKAEEAVKKSKEKPDIYWGEPLQTENKEETKEIDLQQFAGQYDKKSCYGRKFYEKISGWGDKNYMDNYREYDGYLYFLAPKVKVGDCVVTHVRKKIVLNAIDKDRRLASRDLLYEKTQENKLHFDTYDKISSAYSASYKENLKEIEEQIPDWVSVKFLKTGYEKLLSFVAVMNWNLDHPDIQEIKNANDKIAVYKEILESVQNRLLEEQRIEEISKDLIQKEKAMQSDLQFVFGRISLTDYRREIIKEFTSVTMAELENDHSFGLSHRAYFSVSHGKIWYATCLKDDDRDLKAEERGGYVVKCLDIQSKKEAIALKLPKGKRGRFPIVQGNILVVVVDGGLTFYNLQNGTKMTKSHADICSYNEQYIFYQKFDSFGKITDKSDKYYGIHTTTGETFQVNKMFGTETGVKLEQIFYIDSYHKRIYASAVYKPKDGGKRVSSKGILSFNGEFEPIDEHDLKYGFFSNFYDGRMEMKAFNGKYCCVNHDNLIRIADIKGNVIEEKVSLDDGPWVCDACGLATANDIVICALDKKYIYMFHNGKWIPILKNTITIY